MPSELCALAEQIKQELCARRWTGGCRTDRALLLRGFEGPIPDAELLHDALLEPVDKTLWLVLELQARSGADTLPGHPELAARVNVRCRATIGKAMTVLRCTRWLTLCTRFGSGPQRPTCILNASPRALDGTLFLDPGYRDFLRQTASVCRHRAQAIAEQVLATVGGAEA